MDGMKKTIVLGILVFAGLVLSIYGFIVLPANVVVQVGASGKPSSVYPKLMVIGLEGLFTIGGALGYFFVDKKESKFLSLSFIGILVSIITLVFNH